MNQIKNNHDNKYRIEVDIGSGGYGCNNYERFEPNNDRIIKKAKEKGISVADVVALITLNNQ